MTRTKPASEVAVSVMMPVRDYVPKFLRAAICSVLGQSSPRWELIVVAEARDHGALQAHLHYARVDPRVRVVSNQGRALSGAFNTGMRQARGDFVAILFGDDLWATDAVASLERHIEAHPDGDFFHSARRYIDDDDRPISGIYAPVAEVDAEDFWRGSPVKHLLCWRRKMALAIGGMDELLNSVGPDDFDFPWTMAEHGARFVPVPDCLYIYRDHRACFRLTTHIPRRTHERELRRILAKHGVDEKLISERVAESRETYLKQCLYSTDLHAKLHNLLRLGTRAPWRETYSGSDVLGH